MRKYSNEEAVIAICREVDQNGDYSGELVCLIQYATPLLGEILWYRSTTDLLSKWIKEPGFYILKGGVYQKKTASIYGYDWHLYHDTVIKKFISGSSKYIYDLYSQLMI